MVNLVNDGLKSTPSFATGVTQLSNVRQQGFSSTMTPPTRHQTSTKLPTSGTQPALSLKFIICPTAASSSSLLCFNRPPSHSMSNSKNYYPSAPPSAPKHSHPIAPSLTPTNSHSLAPPPAPKHSYPSAPTVPFLSFISS